MPWRGPEYPGELPTLGWFVLDWMRDYLIVPDGPGAGSPLELTPDQAQFVLNLYAVDPASGKRRVRRGVFSRPKGSGKSPLLGGLCIVEALADVVPDGWDASGEPIGRPWTSLGYKAKTQIVAVSEDQTANTWDPVLDMCREGPVGRAYDIEPLETMVNVPRGKIEYVTSSATSREGFRPIFAVLDQTESWVQSNGGHKLASAVRRNLTKTGGSSVETPNSFRPGEESVAEKTYEAYQLQRGGKLKGDDGILWDHREAPPETDPGDRESLLAGLAYAYGCSAKRPGGCAIHGPECNQGWVDLERVLYDYWDPSTEPADARMYFLNQITSASDAWITQPEWAGRADPLQVVADDEPVTLGFDGSRRRNRGIADATALIGCRVSDGHIFEIRVWEQPPGTAGQDWQVPTAEVDNAVGQAMKNYNVVGFYADPAKWESFTAKWEATYGADLKVKSSRDHPIEWWMSGGRSGLIVRAMDQFHSAVVDGEMTHDGSSTLMRHVLNARRRATRSGIQIAKEHPDSARKIDAAVAATLAWTARLDAIAAGVLEDAGKKKSRRIHRF